jgi:hypothetical protein
MLLFETLIYKIARRITTIDTTLNCSFNCTFPKRNGIITSFLLTYSHKFLHVQRFELDPEAPKKVLLIDASKNET